MASAADLRRLLLDAERPSPTPAAGTTEAGVLVPLFAHAGALHAVFTIRRSDLRRHAGEISFPGGRQDFPEEDLRVTALREAEEEIGLPREEVDLVGALPATPTIVTGYRIHPFVGLIRPGREWRLEPREVEAVLELSLPALVLGFESRRLLRKGVPIKTATYTVDGHLVWGATARIVSTLLDQLSPLLRPARS